MLMYRLELAAQWLVDEGQSPNIDFAMRTLNDLAYDAWDSYDPEDTLRFFALRMHKLGLIKKSPEVLVEEIADWRFLNELKQELKVEMSIYSKKTILMLKTINS